MPTFMALQRCPDLIVLPTRFDVYRREAAVIREILHRFTHLVEPISLDFLVVKQLRAHLVEGGRDTARAELFWKLRD